MVIVVYSETSSARIQQNLGESEYSYYFVLKAFRPVLEQAGRVVTIVDPVHEVDAIYRRAASDGEDCVFLSFSPPHRTPLDLACPTIPVIAWEYDTIPNETWSGERHQDWRFGLRKFGRAITLSGFSANAIRSALGPAFPAASIPAPIFDRFKSLRAKANTFPPASRHRLNFPGRIVDTRAVDQDNSSGQVSLELDGVIYLSVLNPQDYRKNYFDLLGGFCSAFKEVEDATLVIKLSHHDAEVSISQMMEIIHKLSPFKCRVVLIDGYLSDEDYGNLLLATTYAVNTSQGEGQCIPLMESMSIGTPAVAPRHTAMLDYLSADNAFLVASTLEPAAWPQDPRGAYRAFSHRINFESLSNAFTESYRVAREQPQQYQSMSNDAKKTLEQHNSDTVTLERLRSFLARTPRHEAPPGAYGQIRPRNDGYSLGNLVDFANEFDARRYLGSGWGATELGVGVWSNGAVAELCFRLERRPTGPLRLRVNLTAFVVKEHPALTVYVSAEDFEIGQWSFSVAQPERINGSWQEATIPPDATWNRAFAVRLKIDQPASPRKLGLSGDVRSLGILLHSLSISSDERVPSTAPTL